MARSAITRSYDSKIFFIFWGTFTLFPIVAGAIDIPAKSAQGFPFLHILDSIYLLSFFIMDILTSRRCYLIVVLFAFQWWLEILSSFSCTCWPFLYLYWKNFDPDPLSILKSSDLFFVCFFAIKLWVFYVFWIISPYQTYDLPVFSSIL